MSDRPCPCASIARPRPSSGPTPEFSLFQTARGRLRGLLRCLVLVTAAALACSCSAQQDQGSQSAGIPGEPSSKPAASASGENGSADAQEGKEAEEEDPVPANPLPYKVTFEVKGADGSVSGQAEDEATGKDDTAASGEESGKEEASASEKSTAEGDSASGEGKDDEKAKEAEEESGAYLADRMKGLSQLVRMKKTLPDGELGLEMRVRRDLKTAELLMQSEGFYDGRAEMKIEDVESGKAKVTVTLVPGKRYVVGNVTILYDPRPAIPNALRDRTATLFPRDNVPGVENGRPVTAPTMLSKVERIPESLHEQGFPDAKLVEQHYYLDRGRKTLNVALVVNPGRAAMLGRVIVSGKSDVEADYVAGLAEWEPGEEIWDSRRVDDYVSELRKTGLFANVTNVVLSDMENDNGKDVPQRPVGVKVEDAKFRTLSAQVRYETATGIGVEGGWEHRNLFHRGEKLTLSLPVSTTATGLKAKFEKPSFFSRNQKLLLNGSALSESTDGYDRRGVSLSGGVERKWSKEYFTYGGLFADVGSLNNNETDSWQDYSVYGAELKVRRDTRDNTLNPTQGSQIEVAFKPMTGEYDGDFSGLGTVVGLKGYYAPFRKADGSPDDKLVLAGRAEAGSFTGASLHNIPPSHRYYLGGSGTVRGYGYQQIGPMDDDDDPEGARSYQLVNLESRFKITEDMGFVTFIDGGMAYTDEVPEFDLDMDWGAGAGIRYFTPIGPVRFDVAVPLKEGTQPPVQFYISIGQAF